MFFIGNPGEMMVHVIDSIRNAMGSEFTPRKVIEYFRENQMILLVERLEAYLRCWKVATKTTHVPLVTQTPRSA